MSLFNKIKNSVSAGSGVSVYVAGPKISRAFSVVLPQAHSFKGFRRIKLKYIDVDGCAETLDAYRSQGFDFKNSTIQIDGFDKVSNGESSRFAKVYVDGNIIGVIAEYMDKGLSFVFDNKFDKVFLKVEEAYHADGSVMGANVYLFVRLCNQLPPSVDVDIV